MKKFCFLKIIKNHLERDHSMKKMISLLLALLCTFSLCAPAAASPESTYGDAMTPSAYGEQLDLSELNKSENEVFSYANGAIQVRSLSQDIASPAEYIDCDTAQFSQRGSGMVTGALENAGDVALYEVTIDHSITPKVLVCYYTFALTNDFSFQIYGEDSRLITDSKIESHDVNYEPKEFSGISATDGRTEIYTLVFTALEDFVGFGFTLGTEENFEEDFGGLEACATVAKNIPYGTLVQLKDSRYLVGYRSLLNVGESFLYVADGPTFITARGDPGDVINFKVYDLDAQQDICATNSSDHVIRHTEGIPSVDFVSKYLKLESGHTYLITFYSTEHISTDRPWDDPYVIWIGLPAIANESIDCTSESFTIPANTKMTYTFTLSGFPKSARLSTLTWIRLLTNDHYMISYCQIKAPNGQTFLAPYGRKWGPADPEIYDYLTTPDNIPINGKWTVTVTSTHTLSNVRFNLSGSYKMILCNDVNWE